MTDPAEAFKKQQIAAHQLWLENPTSQLVLKLVRDREEAFKQTLIDHILSTSNKEYEDKLRACINTCKAIRVALTDSDIFVIQTTKK